MTGELISMNQRGCRRNSGHEGKSAMNLKVGLIVSGSAILVY